MTHAGPNSLRSVWWEEGTVRILDQTRLPHQTVLRTCRSWMDVQEAIQTLQVRGAPAIGAAAAYGMALAAAEAARGAPVSERSEMPAAVGRALREAAEGLLGARPTAVNLRWALERMLQAAEHAVAAAEAPEALAAALLAEARAIAEEDVRANEHIAEAGAALIRAGERILTYCNTGALATVGVGTAYGILRKAHAQGKGIEVVACETRPMLQGSRLTGWELLYDGIPATLITDNAAASLMAAGRIDRVLVGADRVARNGDVANKIGTYGLAVLAQAHEIPFVVAAPLSTVDMRAASGADIPIEERDPAEVTHAGGRRTAPAGIRAYNPAFDVTPHGLVTLLVTDRGVVTPPYEDALTALLGVGARR